MNKCNSWLSSKLETIVTLNFPSTRHTFLFCLGASRLRFHNRFSISVFLYFWSKWLTNYNIIDIFDPLFRPRKLGHLKRASVHSSTCCWVDFSLLLVKSQFFDVFHGYWLLLQLHCCIFGNFIGHLASGQRQMPQMFPLWWKLTSTRVWWSPQIVLGMAVAGPPLLSSLKNVGKTT